MKGIITFAGDTVSLPSFSIFFSLNKIKYKNGFRQLGVVVVLLIAGFLGAWWRANNVDHGMRENMLQQAQLLEQSLNTSYINVLSQLKTDSASPVYARIKAQLSTSVQINPKCWFPYLMGRKPDGKVFILMDSEPDTSREYSPPGQIYSEVSTDFLRVFNTRKAAVTGPVTDRWGTWVSALVPIININTGQMIAVMGMDIDARDWRREVACSVIPVVIFTLLLILILLTGLHLKMRRRKKTGKLSLPLKYLEPLIVVALGLVLTSFVAWISNQKESHDRNVAFRNMASIRTTGIARTLHNLCSMELEGLANYCASTENITQENFQRYTRHLTNDPMVKAWEWIPAIPENEKSNFELEAIKEGLPGFIIWEKGDAGKKIPASERKTYHPVFCVAPLSGNKAVLGFDVGSESCRKAALDEATRTRLSTVTNPITLIQVTDRQTGMLICRPVFKIHDTTCVRGFALAVLTWENALMKADPDSIASFRLLLLDKDGKAPMLLFASDDHKSLTGARPSVTFPIFAFGRVIAMTLTAGPEFLRIHPARASRIVILTGLLLTLVLTIVIGANYRKREQMEKLIAERTSNLRQSDERHRLLFNNSNDAMVTVAPPSWNFTSGNLAALRLFGINTLEEFTSLGPWDLSPGRQPDGRPSAGMALDAIETTLQDGSVFFEWRHRRADGSEFPATVLLTKIDFDSHTFIQATVRDITEQKKIEGALLESEMNFRTFFETISDLVIVATPDGQILYTNKSLQDKLGYTFGELLGMIILDLHPPDKHDEAMEIFSAMLRGERQYCPLPLISKSGHLLPVETRVWRGRWNGNDCIFGLCKDLSTEQEAQQRFERLFRNNPALMAVSSIPERRFVDVNESFLRVLCYSREDILGKTNAEIGLFAHPEQQASIAAYLETTGSVSGVELKVRRKDGIIIDGLFSGDVISSQGRQYFLTVMVDITGRKQG